MNEPRLFTILYCSAIAMIVGWRHRDQFRYLTFSRTFRRPGSLLGLWRMPRLSDAQFHGAGAALVCCLALAAAGIFPRVALCFAMLLYFPYFGQILGLSYVNRKTNLMPLVLLALAFTSASGAGIWALSPAESLQPVKAILVQSYLASGLTKIRNMGFRWADGTQLQAALLFHHLYYDIPLAAQLARHLELCRFLSIFSLFFELTFWIVLIVPGLSPVFALAGITFHVGILLLMRIDYLTYQAPVYLVFAVPPIARLLAAHAAH